MNKSDVSREYYYYCEQLLSARRFALASVDKCICSTAGTPPVEEYDGGTITHRFPLGTSKPCCCVSVTLGRRSMVLQMTYETGELAGSGGFLADTAEMSLPSEELHRLAVSRAAEIVQRFMSLIEPSTKKAYTHIVNERKHLASELRELRVLRGRFKPEEEDTKTARDIVREVIEKASGMVNAEEQLLLSDCKRAMKAAEWTPSRSLLEMAARLGEAIDAARGIR